jgi:hypothetical protein
MKRFTPDLMARFGSDDPAVWKPAETEWDDRAERYREYLDSIRPALPAGLRHIEDSYYLHDAIVRGMGQREHLFLIVLQLDTEPHLLVNIMYDLVGLPAIDRAALPVSLRTRGEHVEWLYDEIEEVSGVSTIWSQSILFSNGWEVCLQFRDVRVEEAQALIPAPHTDEAAPMSPSVPQSA